MKVVFDEQNTLTLRQIAEELAKMYRWRTFDVDAKNDVIAFTSEDGRLFNLRLTGFAYEVKDGVESDFEDDEHSVNLCEDLDYCDLVWGRDEEGCAVAVHN